MIPVLALTILAFSSSMDEPSEQEKTWAERFSQIDFLRNLWGTAPLTTEERMRLLLGQEPILRVRSLVAKDLAEKLYVVYEPGNPHSWYR